MQDFGGGYLILAGGGLPALLAFQQVDDPTPGKNKVHLDLSTDDLDAEVERLVGAGATLVGTARRRETSAGSRSPTRTATSSASPTAPRSPAAA